MKYFIFRNHTVEALFGDKDVVYSGYDDISFIPDEAHAYIWFYLVPPGESESVASEVATYRDKLVLTINRAHSDKQFIIFTLEPLLNTTVIGNNHQLPDAINEFNRHAFHLADEYKNVKVINLNEFTRNYPAQLLVNWKFYFISQTLLNPKLASDFKNWWDKKENELALKRKKCLVLDLDNTLWGGILGEEGMEGIKIGGDYPGKAFAYWQKALLSLKKSGVMLAVCSKNNEADVLEAWESHPSMILRKEHFVAWRINWQDKATNIKELSEELNIGLDSMVFVDDNPTERELIKQMLPMVTVPDFPSRPYELMAFFDQLANNCFRVYSITEEDLKKTEQYQANARRAAEKNKFSDFNDYLKSLEIKIDILPLDRFNLSRLAQMTQKTNQFNLTTRRYTENDITRMADEGCLIYAVSVSDKFGDNGITGEIILRPKDDSIISIDTFLLSCRILGKGIEFAFIDTILNMLAKEDYKTIEATFIKTAKNNQVADFYDRAGFILTGSSGNEKTYKLELTEPREIKDFYTITSK